MKILIEAESKEITALVLAIQEWHGRTNLDNFLESAKRAQESARRAETSKTSACSV